ncbi:MAG: hypothetical protein JSW39_30555 [Desulfobacterales bacterium]|nr:MAG: hypothetical protein JSW39_30555 [Desulfobacterales bacterium]
MNFRQKLMIAGVDTLILAELTFAVYKSAQGPVDDSAAIFLKFFVPAATATIAIGRLVVRKMNR